MVLEADGIGSGSSRRNNGAIVPYLFQKQYELEARFGKVQGTEIARIAVDAVDFLLETCDELGIHAQVRGFDRYFLALTDKHREKMYHSCALQAESSVNTGWVPISAEDLQERTGLSGYAGSIFVSNSLTFHPGIYHQGVIKAAEDAGAVTVAYNPVTSVRSTTNGTLLSTPKGQVLAKDVIVATNGYTGAPFNYAKDGLMSVRIYNSATEPLPDGNKAAQFAARHLLVDSSPTSPGSGQVRTANAFL